MTGIINEMKTPERTEGPRRSRIYICRIGLQKNGASLGIPIREGKTSLNTAAGGTWSATGQAAEICLPHSRLGLYPPTTGEELKRSKVLGQSAGRQKRAIKRITTSVYWPSYNRPRRQALKHGTETGPEAGTCKTEALLGTGGNFFYGDKEQEKWTRKRT